MFIPAAVSLLLAATAPVEHRARVDHASGAVEALYRADVSVEHRQVGGVGAPGRPSTLGCVWSASVAVVRDARHPSGSRFTRTMAAGPTLEGRRAGWCSTQRAAIAQEVAQRSQEVRDHVVALAREDHEALRAEIDQAHGGTRTG